MELDDVVDYSSLADFFEVVSDFDDMLQCMKQQLAGEDVESSTFGPAIFIARQKRLKSCSNLIAQVIWPSSSRSIGAQFGRPRFNQNLVEGTSTLKMV